MDESEDNMSADDTKSGDISITVKSKPKKRSLVERELETNLTARVTSPVTNGGASNTSRYGRARRVKTDSDFSDSEKVVPKLLNSSTLEMTPSDAQPAYETYASNSPVKPETAKETEENPTFTESNLDNQIESIYNENILLSRFSFNNKRKQSPNTKFPKVYVRTDLIQKKEKDESVTLIKNTFSPGSGRKLGNSHLNNILERSSEKYNLNASTTKTKQQNGLTNMSSAVKILNFENNTKRKENHNKMVLSKSEIFELEAKCEYQVGDLAWARMGSYPFWPCIVTREPITNMFVKKKLCGRVEHHMIHVTFFGDNGRRSWIIDSMLRKFLGQLEFETAREHFDPTVKKRDPKLFAAFFVSEKKMSQWSISVEEAETLLREPKRLRIDIFNDMLVKSRSVKAEKPKGNKVVRTSSNVSLSESLFDTLFSEKEGKDEDLDGSRSKTRNSLDVSEVVTACLDNMAAKTGNSKIQRQSHMDRWLQKAKSKTPEKLQVKLQISTKEKEKVISSKKKWWEAPKNVPIKKPYNFRNSLESQTLKSHHNEHDYSSREKITDAIDTTENCLISGGGIGIIAKVESLKDKAEDKKYDILVEIIESVDKDVTCESPTFTQDYSEMYDASLIQDVDMVMSNEDSEKPKSNEINGNEPGKHKKVGIDLILKNHQGGVEIEFQHPTILNKVSETTSLDDDKINKATEICMEADFDIYHKTPNKVCNSDMNGHLEESTDMNFICDTNISKKKSRASDTNIEENYNVAISSKHDIYIDINKSSDSGTIQDSDTGFNTSSQEDNYKRLSYFTRPRTHNKSARKKRNLHLKSPKKPHAAKNRDDGFAKYAELRQDVLIDEHPELTQTEIMAYLLKTWQYENRDESDTGTKSKDIKLDKTEKDKESENTLNSTKKSDNEYKSKNVDISQDRNQSKNIPIKNTLNSTKSFDNDAKSKDMNISQDHNQSKDKPTTILSDESKEKLTMKSSEGDLKSKDIDISQDCNQSKDKQTTKLSDDDAKRKDIDISHHRNHCTDKPTTKSSDYDSKSKDINTSKDRNQLKDKPITKLSDDDAKSKDIDISQDRNQSKDKSITKSSDDDPKSKDIEISQDRNQSRNKPSTKLFDDVKSKDIDISQDHNQSKDKPKTISSDDDAKSKEIDIILARYQSKDNLTTQLSDDDAKSKDKDIEQDHNESKDKSIVKSSNDDVKSKDISRDQNQPKFKPNTKSSDDAAKSKDIDIRQNRKQSKHKTIENTLDSMKSSVDDLKSKSISISQLHNNSKKKVMNALNKKQRSSIEIIKTQAKNKVCTVNLTDILLDSSINITFNNADATFVKAIYEKANKSQNLNSKKVNRKNRTVNSNDVFALKTESTTSKMNDADTSSDGLGSDLLNTSSDSGLKNKTINGYKNTIKKRFSVTAIQTKKEKAINNKKTESYTTSLTKKDNNSIYVLSQDKLIEKNVDEQDATFVGKLDNEIAEMNSELSLEINNDSFLMKHCSDKNNIQDENLCNVFVENKENVNIENNHTEISSTSSSESIIDFTDNMLTGSSDIIANNSNTNVNTGDDNEPEIASILKSIDDIICDNQPKLEEINPKLNQNESFEEINLVEKGSGSLKKGEDKKFKQNKKVEILTEDDCETSKSQLSSKEQHELSINNENVNVDKKMLIHNINKVEDKETPLQNLPEPVKVNGFHSFDDGPPDFGDREFNVETSSVNSEDSEPLSKVKNKLRLKNRNNKNIDVNYPEFIKYMELRQDTLMDDHPELSHEELVDYMHKAWLYEQNSKSDYMKTDDIERSGLVKGLNDDLRQKSIRNSFRENKKRRNKQKDEDSLSIHSDITSKESSPERKLLVKSDDTKSINSDISDRSLRRKRRIKTLDETLKTQATPAYITSDMLLVPDNQIESSNAQDTENEQGIIATRKTQPSSSNDCSTQRNFEIFNHVEGKNEKKSEGEATIKIEFDSETVSIKSDDIEVSLSKRKQRRYEKQATKEDPEFLKYLDLRQDALIDENPQLSQDEIISYLYKTWLYEEGAKSDLKKCDDIEQASLVKGLNPEATQPKKVKKKIKNEKEAIIDDDTVPKDKPKRKTSQPYYIEDELSDTEDIEMFDIFKSKQQLQNNEVIGDIVDTVDDIDGIDEVELYFSELTKPKPNIFKGLVREKVCEICESTSNLVKCKGCSCMFHVDCVRKQLQVKVEVPVPTKGRKKKKKPGRKPKNLDESESQSDEKSQDFSEENNVSIEDLEPESQTVDAEDFESVLEVKMKELIPVIEIYDSYSSDDGLDWNGSVAGKCEIVDVVLKPKSEPVDYSDFKCNNCIKFDLPVCFVCKHVISKTGVEYRQRCQTAHCNTYYHLECLDHWPQTQFNAGELSKISNKLDERFEDFMCPKHVCHTCVCDDPRGCKTRFSGDKLARCVRCPATYHSFTKCLPAGSQILTGSHIVCPRHCEHRPGKVPCHVNTGWCFICALGGSLICCEYCPTSFHAECLNIKPPEGGYMCEDCETGRLPLYGEMVWVKLGHYRWWPGIVLHPSEIPENIMAVKHSPGEFVVRFFGQYDYYWVNRGRVFPFQEGDSGRISSQKSKIDAAFTTAMEHAQRACEILKSENNDVEDTDIASSLLPPHYVKLKVNKPVGSLCGRRIDIEESSLTQCDCNPDEEDPCGPYSQCLNRMLLTECGPSCRAGDRCNNRSFEKRRYPRVAPYRTPHRGWGLRTLQNIKAGTFVIEYVGELLDEEEFRRRMNRKHEIRDENFYFLTLDKERMIDAGPKGNLARFMNHCCEPNCETQKWTVLGDVRVGLFAIKDIPANSELTFNYNLECTGIEKKRCMCGAKRCSGYIGAKPKQDEPPQKKKPLVAKRPYKKRNKTTEDSPSTNKNKPKRPVGRPAKPKELTEIEKDLLIIKNATNGLSSDSEGSGRLSSLDSDKNIKALKRKRVDFSTDDVVLYDTNSPSSKKAKLNEEKAKEVSDINP